MNNNTKNTNITIDGHNICRTSTLWNNIRQSATTINELTESMSKDFREPETYEEFKSMNRDVKKILQTAITLKRNMDVINGRLEGTMIHRDASKHACAPEYASLPPAQALLISEMAQPGEPEASQLAPTLAEWSTLLRAVETFINNVAHHLTNITNIDFCTGQQQTKDDKPDVSHRDLTAAEWNDCLRELEASMTDTTRCLTARDLDVCDDQLSEPTVDKQQDKDGIAKDEPVKAPESPQNAPEGVETAYTAKMEETPAKPVVEPPKVKTPVFRFIPTVCDTNNFDVLTLDGFSTMPYAVGVRVTGEDEMPFQYGLLAAAIKKVIDTLNDVMTPAATLNPFPAKPEDFINGVYCGFKNVKFTIINADWVPGGATAVAVTIEHENGGFSCTTGRNVVVHVDLRKDVLEHGLKALAEGANKLLMAVSQQAE